MRQKKKESYLPFNEVQGADTVLLLDQMFDNERANAIPIVCILAESVVQHVASNHEWLGFRLLAYVCKV